MEKPLCQMARQQDCQQDCKAFSKLDAVNPAAIPTAAGAASP
jgi:hypothetical protein